MTFLNQLIIDIINTTILFSFALHYFSPFFGCYYALTIILTIPTSPVV